MFIALHLPLSTGRHTLANVLLIHQFLPPTKGKGEKAQRTQYVQDQGKRLAEGEDLPANRTWRTAKIKPSGGCGIPMLVTVYALTNSQRCACVHFYIVFIEVD